MFGLIVQTRGAVQRGVRVLLIDGDPQANATMTVLDGQEVNGPTIGDLLLAQVEAGEAIRRTRLEGMDLIPADAMLADAVVALSEQLGRESRLRRAMRAVDGYDLVIVDAAPELNLVTINILNYVGELLVPVDAGLYSVVGLGRLKDTVNQVRTHLDNQTVRIVGLVLTRAHNNRATKDLETQLREVYTPLVHKAVIPHSVRVEEAHARHRTVLEFAPRSTPALAYDRLLTEVLGHGETTGGNAAESGEEDVTA